MKHLVLFFATLLLLGIQSYAQTGVAINSTGADPHNSAMLDVSSIEKGILVPRMTQAQRTAIANPAEGLLVYQNNGTEGFYYYDGMNWTRLGGGTVTGVSATAPIVSTGGTAPVISVNPATTSAAGSMSAADKTKLDGIANNANNYTHPSGDGNLHVPATGTGNNGKVLTAGATSGSLSWVTPTTGTVTSIATGNGITGGPITTSGTLGLTGQALALHNLSSNGIITRTGTGTAAARSIAASGNGISVSNGDGVSGNPSLSLNIGTGATQVAAGNHIHGNITSDGKIGTTAGSIITTGTNGTLQAKAGTASGDILYWNGTAWVTTAAGTYGQVLEFRNGAPVWVDKNINSLSIGDTYKGGIIVYFLQPGDPGYDANVRHGIIAAPNDQGIAHWGCYGTAIGGTLTALGTGANNTTLIVNACTTAGIIARICSDLVLNGYDDWYLPSRDEMNQLYLNRSVLGGLTTYAYLSSSEHDSQFVWGQYLITGGQGIGVKNGNAYFRAIRSF